VSDPAQMVFFFPLPAFPPLGKKQVFFLLFQEGVLSIRQLEKREFLFCGTRRRDSPLPVGRDPFSFPGFSLKSLGQEEKERVPLPLFSLGSPNARSPLSFFFFPAFFEARFFPFHLFSTSGLRGRPPPSSCSRDFFFFFPVCSRKDRGSFSLRPRCVYSQTSPLFFFPPEALCRLAKSRPLPFSSLLRLDE